jgi:hypothetical protein
MWIILKIRSDAIGFAGGVGVGLNMERVAFFLVRDCRRRRFEQSIF